MPEISERMATICLKCGDKGWDNALVYCIECLEFAVHRYCLDRIPKTLDEFVSWACEDCEKETPHPTLQRHSSISKKKGDTSSIGTKEQTPRAGPSDGVYEDHFQHMHESPSNSTEKKNMSSHKHENRSDSLEKKHKSGHKHDRCSNSMGKKHKSRRHKHEITNNSMEKKNSKSSSAVSGQGHLIHCSKQALEAGTAPTQAQEDLHVPAEPVEEPIWRGDFIITNKNQDTYDGFVAHVSNKACSKVCNEARLLRPLLQLEMCPKLDVWPKSFKTSEPSDESIALYFFPADTSSERVFDDLVEYMMENELALIATVENAELLLFTSIELPLLYWRFQGKYYLWGVFRGKQAASGGAKKIDDVSKCIDPANAGERSLRSMRRSDGGPRSPISPIAVILDA